MKRDGSRGFRFAQIAALSELCSVERVILPYDNVFSFLGQAGYNEFLAEPFFLGRKRNRSYC